MILVDGVFYSMPSCQDCLPVEQCKAAFADPNRLATALHNTNTSAGASCMTFFSVQLDAAVVCCDWHVS
jgi:hypothetical protein